MEPFLDLDPQDWPIESKRIDIITQLVIDDPLPNGRFAPKVMKFFTDDLPCYVDKYQHVQSDCLRNNEPCVKISEVYEVIKDLVNIQI